MDTLLIYCLLNESPPINDDEAEIIKSNHENIINNGRSLDQNILLNGRTGTAASFAEAILSDLKEISAFAGDVVFENEQNYWVESIALQIKKLENLDETLSGSVLSAMMQNNQSFKEFGLKLAKSHSQDFKTTRSDRDKLFEQAAKESLKKQEIIESQNGPDFETFLKGYFNQTA
jgi:glutamate--cysteine ligase